MCSVGADKDVSMGGSIVTETEHHSLVVLLERENLFRHMDFVWGDLSEQHVVQLGTSEQNAIIADSMQSKEKKVQVQLDIMAKRR